MSIPLRQSTPSQEIPLGYFVDSTDGNTEETVLTIANSDIKLWKNGATSLANKNSGGATHISNGIYYATLDDTDTNTPGPLLIFVHVSGALAVRVECVIHPANIYDSLFAGTDVLEIDVSQWKGSTAPANSGDAYARLGIPAGASVSADVAAIKSETADILTDTGTTLDALIKDLPTVAEFEARTLVAADYIVVSDTLAAVTTVGSVTAPVTAGTVSDKTGYALSSAGVQAVWDALTSALTTAGSVGKRIADYLDAAVSSRSTYEGGDTSGTTTLLSRIVGTLATGTHNAQSGDAYAVVAHADHGNAKLVRSTTPANTLDVNATGEAGIDWGNIGAPTTTVALSNTSVLADITKISGDTIAANNAESFFDNTGFSATSSTIGTVNYAGTIGSSVAIIAGGIDTSAFTSNALSAIADAILKRDWSAVTGEAARSLLNAGRFLRNKWSISGATLTVTKEDDTTSAWTATLSTDAGADPVTGSDPA